MSVTPVMDGFLSLAVVSVESSVYIQQFFSERQYENVDI